MYLPPVERVDGTGSSHKDLDVLPVSKEPGHTGQVTQSHGKESMNQDPRPNPFRGPDQFQSCYIIPMERLECDTQTHTHTHTHTITHMPTHTCAHTYTHTHAHIHTQTHIHTPTHIYHAHMHAHTHTQTNTALTNINTYNKIHARTYLC